MNVSLVLKFPSSLLNSETVKVTFLHVTSSGRREESPEQIDAVPEQRETIFLCPGPDRISYNQSINYFQLFSLSRQPPLNTRRGLLERPRATVQGTEVMIRHIIERGLRSLDNKSVGESWIMDTPAHYMIHHHFSSLFYWSMLR